MFTKQIRMMTVAAGVLLAATTAQADSIQNKTGLAGLHTTITFGEAAQGTLDYPFAQGTFITNQFAGVTISTGPSQTSGLLYNSAIASDGAYSGITGGHVGNRDTYSPSPSIFIPQFSLLFGGDVTEAAFSIATNFASTFFEALDNGVVKDSFTADTSYDGSTNYFFGFTGITFDEIRITQRQSEVLIDNVQLAVAAVPEPETYAMMLAGLGLLGFVARRRKQQAA
jgi:hypothetical protein